MKKRNLLLINFLITTAAAFGQSLPDKLQAAFNHLQHDDQCRYASVSLTILDARTGETVFTANPNMGLATASTLKTVTSITAMNVLGPDYRFETSLWVDGGTINPSGELQGNLVIDGHYDPTLGSWRWEETKENVVLAEFVNAVKKAGIKKISGAVIATGVNKFPPGWIWQDLGNYYGAPPNALCWHENQYDIILKRGAVGKSVEIVKTVPALPYLQFDNQLTTGAPGTGDQAYASLPITGNIVSLQGTFAADLDKHGISPALPDPPYELARRLKDTLEKLGITVVGGATSETMLMAKDNPDITVSRKIGSHFSPPLRKVIYWLNQKSINLYAEDILMAMADSLKSSDPPSVVKKFWKDRGVDPNSLNIFDGSGLSPGDRVTTTTVAHILQSATKESWFPDFYASLPVYNDMKMKSGSIANVLAYAGFQTYHGRQLCFSIIVNNYNGPSSGIKQKLFVVLDELK